MSGSDKCIRLLGVRQNNLKGFDLDLPVGQLTVVTGLSGAGKSSLVFETLHAEGQRRYVETFSPYARQFMELLDRPKVDRVENIRPSIAIQQSNKVKTSRSTVGTITELADYFKVWFANVATLHDPLSGARIYDDNPQSVWKQLLREYKDRSILICFRVSRPDPLSGSDILQLLSRQGYTRLVFGGRIVHMEQVSGEDLPDSVCVVQDRIRVEVKNRSRAIEALDNGFKWGKGTIRVLDRACRLVGEWAQGLRSPETGRSFRPAGPAMFSFNSPIGACSRCRGFGRIIEIDYRLVIPDPGRSIDDGAIRAFHGKVYQESLRELQRAAQVHGVRTDVPWSELNRKELKWIMEGEQGYQPDSGQWYGLHRFFDWLNRRQHRMHIRIFLSKFRGYTECPECHGARLNPESLCWKWKGYTLPELYQKSVSELIDLITPDMDTTLESDAALAGILSRLRFLDAVGLSYLTLDRSSRTLSGGETMRVSLTTCLGSAITDTLFVLDEPSVGLHPRDMKRLIRILRRLTDMGNTVVVVEHDEAIMRESDNLIEIGPKPGLYGGQLIFNGSYQQMLQSDTQTGRFLSGRETIEIPEKRRLAGRTYREAESVDLGNGIPQLSIYGASKHNIRNLDVRIPQQSLVCLSGVSGSGKSTLLNNVIYQNLLARKGLSVEDPAIVQRIEFDRPLSNVVLVDQSPTSKTPRSTPASYSGVWDEIRRIFSTTERAKAEGLKPGYFSYNRPAGRCPDCSGRGYERMEMQFISDIDVLCESCEGRRFKNEVLEIEFNGRNVDAVQKMEIAEARIFFANYPKVLRALQPLIEVGLGYLKLGQALNTLSGGESQRLKLVRYLGRIKHDTSSKSDAGSALGKKESEGHNLILIDEPTTGLHRADIKCLIAVFQRLVEAGHSLIVIEHNPDILKVADWIIELGPEAGVRGGRIVAQGSPERIAESSSETAVYLREALGTKIPAASVQVAEETNAYDSLDSPLKTKCLDSPEKTRTLRIQGAREHNLKNISCQIRHNQLTVVTGVSGSGKSSLAFDIIFAEGQRRFMESMSAHARQFVESLPRADIDEIYGIPPTVAIEQRVNKGTRKSTVATITEVAQYLRLLYARIGVQYSPTSGHALVSQSESALLKRLKDILADSNAQKLYLCAPLIVGRTGHHEPVANRAKEQGYKMLRVDGRMIALDQFQKLNRYAEHDIDLVVSELDTGSLRSRKSSGASLKKSLLTALSLGKGSAFLLTSKGRILSRLSTKRTDPVTGEAFPDLYPKHFSWNSPRGWCPTCSGYGQLFPWMRSRESAEGPFNDRPDGPESGQTCPECEGTRLNPLSRAVRLPLRKSNPGIHSSGKSSSPINTVSLPELLSLTPSQLVATLKRVKTNARSKPILAELLPGIEERMRFMDQVGLGYLRLNRASATLSGGEAQRIRLAAQLGSNLSGVLYVLDEPSIGLHAQDNARLLESMEQLLRRGNTLIVVEHNEATMRRADQIIDLGPGAGVCGGEMVADGSIRQIQKARDSLTGQYLRRAMRHPLRGQYRKLPAPWSAGKKKGNENRIVLRGAGLRNLKGFDLQIPKQCLTVVCGVSGSGKSTLVRDLLKPLLQESISNKCGKLSPRKLSENHPLPDLNSRPADPFASKNRPAFKALHHADDIRKVIEIDASPIGKTSRSTPATYIGAFDIIRTIYAQLPAANLSGYTSGTFSFNTSGGRCETCRGVGHLKLEMNFMPDSHVTCEDCNGRRYGSELDELRWKGKSIADVLEMSFEEAGRFFSFHTRLARLMQLMVETGLGYITLGQYSPTLSGGEAQRMKLVSELAKGEPGFKELQYNKGRGNLYILEEPTIGLHPADVERLIELFHRLVDQGHTVIVIEHHLEVIKDADYIVELGPCGGEEGGQLLYQGNLAGLRKCANSITAPFLGNAASLSK